MPIPESTLAGHRRLHDRISTALDLCQESQNTEFKESASWETLQVAIAKTAMAMANLRDGGIMVIGVAARGEEWELAGITAEHLATYDVDNVVAFVNRFASPHCDLDIVRFRHANGNSFLAIQAREFEKIPVICKRAGADGSGLADGYVFVRPAGVVRTTRVMDADQMRDLLELAAEKQARQILEMARRVGLTAPVGDDQQFDRELGDIE